MSGSGTGRRTGWQIFRWPIVLALVTTIGLVAALVGDGWHDLVSWLALGTVVAVMVAAWFKAGRKGAGLD